jgi:hypothetical protein
VDVVGDALGRQLEELERPKAKERQGLRTDLTSASAEAEVKKRTGTAAVVGTVARHSPLAPVGANGAKGPRTGTDDIVGEALGISRGTYQRLKTVDNATRHDDESVRDVARDQPPLRRPDLEGEVQDGPLLIGEHNCPLSASRRPAYRDAGMLSPDSRREATTSGRSSRGSL